MTPNDHALLLLLDLPMNESDERIFPPFSPQRFTLSEFAFPVPFDSLDRSFEGNRPPLP